MRKATKAIIMLLAFSSTFLFGYISSRSNILGIYPSFESKAIRPSKPYGKDEYSINRYKREVREYAEDAENYVKAGNNDIETIERAKSMAIQSANQVIEEYNRFMRSGY